MLFCGSGNYALTGADVAFAIPEEVPPIFAGGGVFRPSPPRPFPVEGEGYGILPELEGEAHGSVFLAGAAAGVLPALVGEATGSAGVAGRSAAQMLVRAAASGACGEVATATAVLKVAAVSSGTAGLRGSGYGMIVKLKGAARGRHDNDEAAIMAILLAA